LKRKKKGSGKLLNFRTGGGRNEFENLRFGRSATSTRTCPAMAVLPVRDDGISRNRYAGRRYVLVFLVCRPKKANGGCRLFLVFTFGNGTNASRHHADRRSGRITRARFVTRPVGNDYAAATGDDRIATTIDWFF